MESLKRAASRFAQVLLDLWLKQTKENEEVRPATQEERAFWEAIMTDLGGEA